MAIPDIACPRLVFTATTEPLIQSRDCLFIRDRLFLRSVIARRPAHFHAKSVGYSLIPFVARHYTRHRTHRGSARLDVRQRWGGFDKKKKVPILRSYLVFSFSLSFSLSPSLSPTIPLSLSHTHTLSISLSRLETTQPEDARRSSRKGVRKKLELGWVARARARADAARRCRRAAGQGQINPDRVTP